MAQLIQSDADCLPPRGKKKQHQVYQAVLQALTLQRTHTTNEWEALPAHASSVCHCVVTTRLSDVETQRWKALRLSPWAFRLNSCRTRMILWYTHRIPPPPHLFSENVFIYLRVIYFIGLSVSQIRVYAVFPGRFYGRTNKKSPFLGVLLIMLFDENVIVVLMSLEAGKNSGTAILFLPAIIYAPIVFVIEFVPSSMILWIGKNTLLVWVPNIKIGNITCNNSTHGQYF